MQGGTNMFFVQKLLDKDEQKYTYKQSIQISSQTGLIGHLRADMDSTGEGFFSSWEDFRSNLKTQAFKDEFDYVINELRKPGAILANRTELGKFYYSHMDCGFNNGMDDFGIRVDTENYAYLMRLNPNKGMYNLYCYCYRKDCLDSHLEDAKAGIRFIDSKYKELFRIPDGAKIVIITATGGRSIRSCRYIDNYHVEIENEIFHICEFAERMEQNSSKYEPMEDGNNAL
jgi:hypothetical protein